MVYLTSRPRTRHPKDSKTMRQIQATLDGNVDVAILVNTARYGSNAVLDDNSTRATKNGHLPNEMSC